MIRFRVIDSAHNNGWCIMGRIRERGSRGESILQIRFSPRNARTAPRCYNPYCRLIINPNWWHAFPGNDVPVSYKHAGCFALESLSRSLPRITFYLNSTLLFFIFQSFRRNMRCISLFILLSVIMPVMMATPVPLGNWLSGLDALIALYGTIIANNRIVYRHSFTYQTVG